MLNQDGIFIGASHQGTDSTIEREYIWLQYANRHGLVTGATGTGKTVTLQVLAESFSAAGVPVFCADVKGDLSGVSKAGVINPKIESRMKDVGLDNLDMRANPVIFWDLFGEQGHPVRTTISDMGPLLLSRLLELTSAQEGVLNIAFRVADEDGLLLLDLKDLQAVLTHISERASELSKRYGNVTKQSVGTIQRQLLVLEEQGGAKFFSEPGLKLSDIIRTNHDGRGIINILAADKLMNSPRLYSTFLFWLMSKLFAVLPEVGDPEKPKLVFFFDEAHLLFDNAPKALVDRIEQVVRLIRSKGVGIYFISQNPLDVPESVLAQLGNRVQHALRAYTPREIAALKTAATTFRPNPDFNTQEAITNLSTGEALVSTLQNKGVPSMVQRTLICPPGSQIGAITKDERERLLATSPVSGVYDETIRRDSAYEMLARKNDEIKRAKEEEANNSGGFFGSLFGSNTKSRGRQTMTEAIVKSATRSASSSLGRSLSRMGQNILMNILKSFFKR